MPLCTKSSFVSELYDFKTDPKSIFRPISRLVTLTMHTH